MLCYFATSLEMSPCLSADSLSQFVALHSPTVHSADDCVTPRTVRCDWCIHRREATNASRSLRFHSPHTSFSTMRNCSCVTARCGIRYGLDVTVGAPMVNYRETIAKDLADFDYRPPRLPGAGQRPSAFSAANWFRTARLHERSGCVHTVRGATQSHYPQCQCVTPRTVSGQSQSV